MKNHNIDDLLESVSPSLIAGYEKQNKVELANTNEEYKRVSDKDPYAIIMTCMKVMLVAGIVALISSLIINIHYNRPYLSLVVMAAIMFPFLAYFKFVVGKKVLRIKEITERCTPILEGFRDAVEGLYPSGRSHEYNEEDTHDELVFCAVQILDAEIKFDAVRVKTERMLHDIIHLGNFIKKWSGKLDETIRHNRKFGIEAKRAELFAEARKHIEQMDQLIAARRSS